ncbi:MAG: segregation/condensation protein A [Candidatus Brocadiaceae bacterium]|nr:segregation/condensation protein A [Candidatus Brocadiaceae bacterium]
MTDEYKIDLDMYNGPVDLLLYLIKKEEVNVYDIPISLITQQYLMYVDTLRILDVNNVGDFLVMAATLMYIKSYMLLPRTEIPIDQEEEDPRSSLVKQLLEYKKFKETSFVLTEKFAEQEKRWIRSYKDFSFSVKDKNEEISLEGVSVWDLLQKFSQLMKQTLPDVPGKVTYDDTPVQVYMNEIMERISCHTKLVFTSLFVDSYERARVIGIFLALLELVRLNKIKIEQPTHYDDIFVTLSPENAMV